MNRGVARKGDAFHEGPLGVARKGGAFSLHERSNPMPESIPSLPFLAELREEVLKHSLKRMPKWKFRLASDLVFQLQPKPTVMLSEAAMARGFKPKLQHFEGVAVMIEGVTGDALKHLPKLAVSALVANQVRALYPISQCGLGISSALAATGD